MEFTSRDFQLIYYAMVELKGELEFEKQDSRYEKCEIEHIRKNLHECNKIIAKLEKTMQEKQIPVDTDVIPVVLPDNKGGFIRNIF